MQPQIKLGRLMGIRIGLHYSWLIIALLMVFSLADHFRTINRHWDQTTVWLSAVITAVLFFAAIVAHELAHSVVAKANGLPVRSITLFALGGVAQIEREAADARTEFWMGIAGPIASVIIGLLCLSAAKLLGWTTLQTPNTPALAMLVWLGAINIALALFNMIPGFPLDGGRVLRALIWWSTGNPARSTQIAARMGQFVAFGFIFLGLIGFFLGSGVRGLWIAFIGWFLLDAARASFAQVEILSVLRGLRVSDVMSHDCQVIDGKTDLQTFAYEYVLRSGRRCFFVSQNGNIVGLVTPHEIKNIDRAQWSSTPLEQVMKPLREVRTVQPESSVVDAFTLMSQEDLNQLPVVSDGHVEGIISRGQILQLLRTRTELHV